MKRHWIFLSVGVAGKEVFWGAHNPTNVKRKRCICRESHQENTLCFFTRVKLKIVEELNLLQFGIRAVLAQRQKGIFHVARKAKDPDKRSMNLLYAQKSLMGSSANLSQVETFSV